MRDNVGVFICRCGHSVAGVVDVESLTRQVEWLSGVVLAACHELLCSPQGKEFLVGKIRGLELGSAVVAACSPEDHEADFRKCLEQAKVSKHLLQMANIQKHCTSVTANREEAYDTSLSMIRAALERARHHKALGGRDIACNTDLVVIGGGIAGMEAALLAAQAGRRVTIVEAGPSAGGAVAQLEEAAPSLVCAPCMLSPRMSALAESENITLLTNSRVTEVLGYFGNFVVTVHQRARLVDESRCLGCEDCVNACPVSVPSSYHRGLAERKAIYVPFPGCVPNCAVVDHDACLRSRGKDCTACAGACPFEALDFNQEDELLELNAGAIVLATGFEPFDPSRIEGLGFGELPDVYTLAQFERLTSNRGPTGGKIVKRDGTPPKRIAIVHCVGRSELGYCSGVCCPASLKAGILARKTAYEQADTTQSTEVIHLHSGFASTGRFAADLKAKAAALGARFAPVGDPASIRIARSRKAMSISYRDPAGELQSGEADMVVLATGMQPSGSAGEMARMLSLARDDAGFFASDHPILRPAQSSVEGIYIAGCAGGPRNIAESIAQAQAAAGAALARLQPGKKLKLGVVTGETADHQRIPMKIISPFDRL